MQRFITILALSLCLASIAAAQQPLGVNLLVNGDFEAGNITGWTAVSGTAVVKDWISGTNIPPYGVRNAIGGGSSLLADSSGNAILRQTFDVSGNAINGPGFEFVLDACLGGIATDVDGANLVADFRDTNGLSLGLASLGIVTVAMRNSESVLLRRVESFPVPPMTTSIRVEIRFSYTSGVVSGLIDNASAQLVMAALPAAKALNTELLVNGDFENGWSTTSAFVPNDPQSWFGLGGRSAVESYAFGLNVPGTDVAAIVSGGANLVSDLVGAGGLAQIIDIRGNIADVDGAMLALDVGALLGGFSTDSDAARIDVSFLDRVGSGALLVAPTQSVGPVTVADRHSRSILMARRRLLDVPIGTRAIRVSLVFIYTSGDAAGCADNVSARLVLRTPIAPAPLGTQLLVNGDFESGDIVGGQPTPFTLLDPAGWTGTTSALMSIEGYGTNATVPTTMLAGQISGGTYLAADAGGGSSLRQTIDVSANPQVAAGTLRVFASGYFGGTSTDLDSARLDIIAVDAIGAQLASFSIGSVTPAQRANATTVLLRQGDFAIPQGTKALNLDLVSIYVSGAAGGLADNLVVTLYDSTAGGPDHYPGTGGNTDLHLFTGLNEQPTTGPGFDIKNAQGGDILYLKLASFGGNADFSPILMAYQAFTTGMPPTPVVAGVALDPFQAVIFIDGVTFFTFFGQPILIPGGTTFVSVIPPGLAGVSVLIQGFAFPSLVGLPAVPPNGVFFAAAAHELRF